MRSSIVHNWTRGAAHRHTTAPISALGLHNRSLILISCPAVGRRLSWPKHTVGQQLSQSCLQVV